MKSRAAQLKDMAWECRMLAKSAQDEKVRDQLLDVAKQFEALAEQHERNSRPSRSSILC
jgi:hypothetical protein